VCTFLILDSWPCEGQQAKCEVFSFACWYIICSLHCTRLVFSLPIQNLELFCICNLIVAIYLIKMGSFYDNMRFSRSSPPQGRIWTSLPFAPAFYRVRKPIPPVF